MASFLASPSSLLCKKPLVLSCSQSPTPPTPPLNQPNNPNQNQPLQISQEAQPSTQPTPMPKKKTTAESTDWVASNLTRRFGIGAGLAWVGFLAFGVVSEQIKTRIEVSQQQANTRWIKHFTHQISLTN